MDIPSVIIPVDVLMEVVRNIKTTKDVLFSYSPSEKLVRFRLGEDEFYSRLIDGEFPPFEKVIQNESATTATLDREEFLRNIKLISVFAREAESYNFFSSRSAEKLAVS
jgi:DNA polymerase-3 subunit beta